MLIVGAKGMLGGALCERFHGDEIVAWDREHDITDQEHITKAIRDVHPDLVINAAAWNDVDGAEDHWENAMRVNGTAPGILADCCESLAIPFVHVSTSWVFNGETQHGFHEEDPRAPLSSYARSKAQGEEEVERRCSRYYIVRGDRLYGSGVTKNIVDTFFKLGSRGEELRVVNDQWGSSVWTRDLAVAMESLIRDQAPFGIYHLVNEGSATWYDLACAIRDMARLSCTITPVDHTVYPRKAPVPRNSTILNTKRPPLRDWREALQEYLRAAYHV